MNHMARVLFDAAVGEESWPRALNQIARSFGGFESHFMIWDRDRSRVDFSAWAEFADEPSQSYFRCEHLIYSRRGQLLLTQNFPDAAFFGDEIYQDFLRPLGTRYLMGSKLADSGSRVAMLRIHRGARKGPYSDVDARKLRLLFPSFSRAAQLHLGHLRTANKAELTRAALDQLEIGILVIDGGQRILHANAFAQDILLNGNGRCVQDGRLLPGSATMNSMLQRSTEDACDLMGASLRRLWGRDFELSVSVLKNGNLPTVRPADFEFLITVKRRKRAAQDLAVTLKTRFALTTAEAFIAEQIARGRTPQQIAAYKSVSINTVKTHLKAVFAKMEVRSQSDLVRTVLMLPDSALGEKRK